MKRIEKIGKYFVIFLIIFSTIFLSFVASNTDNPIYLPTYGKKELYNLFPQGWAFFTRDPKEKIVFLFERQGNHFHLLNNSASLSFKDIFGIKRYKRKLSGELDELIKKIPNNNWTRYDDKEFLNSFDLLTTSDTLQNITYDIKLLTGEKIICLVNPTPWAWLRSQVRMPSRCVKVFVK